MYQGISDPLTAEALGLRDGVLFTKEQGFAQVILEVDCYELARRWTESRNDQSIIRPILDEISELGEIFISFSVVFARREPNQAAHSCTRYAVLQEETLAGMLSHSLDADCNHVFMN